MAEKKETKKQELNELVYIQYTLKAPKNQRNNFGGYNQCKVVDDSIVNYILSHFSYNSQTGEITRDDRRNSLGSLDKDGYLIIKIKKRQYKAHRIAWLLHYGRFPTKEIDHINRNRSDNRISNLREVDRCENNRNSSKKVNPKTGVIGVYLDECTNGLRKRFTTRFLKRTYRFYTLEEAVNFRKQHNLSVI